MKSIWDLMNLENLRNLRLRNLKSRNPVVLNLGLWNLKIRNLGFREFAARSLLITLGAAMYAFGVQYFILESGFMEGGVTGVALLLKYIFNVPPWIVVLLFNIPLYIAGWKITGFRQTLYTLVGSAAYPFFLWLMEVSTGRGWLPALGRGSDDLLTAVYAGVITGVGLGIVLRYGGSTGGTTLIAQLAKYMYGWRQGLVILIFDVLVIGLSLLYLPVEKVQYTLVMVFISARTIDWVTQRALSAKSFTVFTKHSARLAEQIQAKMERGVTLYPAVGGYSHLRQDVVYCVVSRSEVHHFKKLVHQLDPAAFLVVQDIHEVLGEGFGRYSAV